VTKTARIPPEELFAALSDATRLRLLNLLRAGEVCVCDLVGSLGVPQAQGSGGVAALAAVSKAGTVWLRRMQ